MYAQLHRVALLLTAQTPAEGGAGWTRADFILPIVMMAILYFVWIRPANRERKAHQSMLEALKRGDEVVTNAGMLGSVADISENIITLEVARNVKIRVLKSTVQKRVADDKASSDAKKSDSKDSKKDDKKSSKS